MGNQIVNELVESINRNKINEALLKTEALLQMALKTELQNTPAYTLHDYFWVLSDLVSEARKLL